MRSVPTKLRPAEILHFPILFFALFFAVSCSGPQSIFESAGPQAENIATLWWVLLGVCGAVFAAVCFFTLKGTLGNKRRVVSDEGLGKGLTWGVGAILCLLGVIVFATFNLSQPLQDEDKKLAARIEIVGKMWWWDVIYYDKNGKELFRSPNELRLPVGKAVKIKLTSDTVIHSFWIPALAGKVDLIPGRVNTVALKANKPGRFRGQCAEFCGRQHALMGIYAIAMPKKDYAGWKRAQARPYLRPKTKLAKSGQKVFMRSRCSDCHDIDGLNIASEELKRGPDLTHLASRTSLAAATYPNNRGHLGGWITDPQSAKPGNYMPATALSPEDFKALTAFLEGLK